MIKTKPYKNITLEFDKEKHRFTINGRNVLSVTAATSMVDKSAPLMGWAVKLFREFLLEKLNGGEAITTDLIHEGSKQHTIRKVEAADIGTQIHDWIELYIKGEKPKIPQDEKVKNGVLAFMKWVDENKVKFLNSEQIIYSKKYDYAGILDIEAKINGKLAIVDIKSSNGVYNEMRYQVSGYRNAKEEMAKKKYDESWIIQLGKETGDFKAYRLDDHPKDFKAFLAALTIKRREMELKSQI